MSRPDRHDGTTEHEDYTKNRRRGERQRAVKKAERAKRRRRGRKTRNPKYG